MIELKFRALRKHKGGSTDMDYSDRWASLSEFFNHLEINYHEAVITQWTGLKDDYENELYFNDKVKLWYGARRNFDVERNVENVEDLANLIFEINEHGASFEVKGNIYNKN